MDKEIFSRPLGLKNVEINDEFWGREQALVRKEVIPYQWDALNDRIPEAEPSFCMRNFKVAGRLMREKRENKKFIEPKYTFRGFNALPKEGQEPEDDKFYGFVFQDSDFAKWIEAVGYCLSNHPDAELEKTADEAIDIVCAAQAENGYLDTYYIIGGMDRIFTNLQDHHELYCFGHLLEGAVSYYEATGKDKLLLAAKRYADFIITKFGPEEGKIHGYPGHEIAEMALVRLYELTMEKKYLELAKYFIDERGKTPYIFDEQAKERAEYVGENYVPDKNPDRYKYYQAHKPVREQDEAVGHAVRAVYLYSGMADVARLTEDEKLYDACLKIWNSIVKEKLYITGGIGGTHLGEAFSHGYDLPNDLAYSESCAAIGLAFFARRMLQIKPDSSIADVMEQALYNTTLAGMALDGKSFFYVNPLEVVPEDCKKDERKHHVKPIRQKWFGCACCPPNIARCVSSVGAYAYTASRDCLYTHLYMSSNVKTMLKGREVSLGIQSSFPWQGDVSASVHVKEKGEAFTLAFRIPGWCKGKYSAFINGKDVLSSDEGSFEVKESDGYLYIFSTWNEDVQIELKFETKIRMISSNEKVRENAGKVAFTKGPVTYCMEQADNGENLWEIAVLADEFEKAGSSFGYIEGAKMEFIDVPAIRIKKDETGELYSDYTPGKEERVSLKLIPYFAWANRGEGEMRVWIPIK